MKSWKVANAVAFILVFSIDHVSAQADGNPHNWDRRRRCDQTDYDPPCTTCEGYGGIPYGDKNDQIYLTTCEIIKNASAIKNPVKPVWGTTFTLHNYNEILSVQKQALLFQFVSFKYFQRETCYRADSGSQVYDARDGFRTSIWFERKDCCWQCDDHGAASGYKHVDNQQAAVVCSRSPPMYMYKRSSRLRSHKPKNVSSSI